MSISIYYTVHRKAPLNSSEIAAVTERAYVAPREALYTLAKIPHTRPCLLATRRSSTNN